MNKIIQIQNLPERLQRTLGFGIIEFASDEEEFKWLVKFFSNPNEKPSKSNVIYAESLSLSFIPEYAESRSPDFRNSTAFKDFQNTLKKHEQDSKIVFTGFSEMRPNGLIFDQEGNVTVGAHFKFKNTDLQDAYIKMRYSLLSAKSKMYIIDMNNFKPDMVMPIFAMKYGHKTRIQDFIERILQQKQGLELDFYPRFVSQFGKE
jgi:hypothetical protein